MSLKTCIKPNGKCSYLELSYEYNKIFWNSYIASEWGTAKYEPDRIIHFGHSSALMITNDPLTNSQEAFLSTAKQGDNRIGSIHPYVLLCVCLCACPSSPG